MGLNLLLSLRLTAVGELTKNDMCMHRADNNLDAVDFRGALNVSLSHRYNQVAHLCNPPGRQHVKVAGP